MDRYEMNPKQRGLCVIIDCVGFDGGECVFHNVLKMKVSYSVRVKSQTSWSVLILVFWGKFICNHNGVIIFEKKTLHDYIF